MFERLKQWVRGPRAPEPEYRTGPAGAPPVIPSGPPTSGMPPAAPLPQPTEDEPEPDR